MSIAAEQLNALALAERKHSVSEPLYTIEDDLLALIETEGVVPPEQDAEFQAELAEQMRKAVVKRDRVAQFIRHCELMADSSKVEEKRLKERREMYQKAADKMRQYVKTILEALGTDEKGKWQKLAGNTATFSLRNNPGAVKVTDESAIASKFKRYTITMWGDTWEGILAALDDNSCAQVIAEVNQRHVAVEVSKTKIKEAMEAGEFIEGADLENSTSLMLK